MTGLEELKALILSLKEEGAFTISVRKDNCEITAQFVPSTASTVLPKNTEIREEHKEENDLAYYSAD